MDRSSRIAFVSCGVAVGVLGIKSVAYLLTGSVALYSDALESIVNVATSIAAVVSIRIAAAAPDAEHPYGHDKAEYVSAVVVGVMIVVAALAILREAYTGFLEPKTIDAPWSGISVGLVATAVNVFWSGLLVREGRLRRSAALVADGKHLLADVVTSVAVLVGVAAVVVTGIRQLDAAIAGLVALHVLWSGWQVVRDNTSGLLDESAPAEELERIRATISASATGALEIHALRSRHAGKTTFVDFHMVVPGRMPTEESHAICDRIEAALRDELPGASVTIHVEPEGSAERKGVLVM